MQPTAGFGSPEAAVLCGATGDRGAKVRELWERDVLPRLEPFAEWEETEGDKNGNTILFLGVPAFGQSRGYAGG